MMFVSSLIFIGCSSNDVHDATPPTLQVTNPDEKSDAAPQEEYVELTIEYTVTSDGEAEVTGYNGTGNRATIASEYEGCKVVRITASAFENCTTLESVVFWADIKEIGAEAFRNCSALVEIAVPNETIRIGNYAFSGCVALKDLIIWGAPEIGDYAFAGCSNIEEVSIPHGVPSVGAHAFDGCSSLTNVIVWDDNTKFGVNAFINCPNLDEKPIEDDESEAIQQAEDTTDDMYHGEQSLVDGKIIMPNSAKYYIGSEWTIETITEHFEALGSQNIRAIPCEPNDDNYKTNIREIYIETGLFSTDPWEAGEAFAPDAEISIYYNEFPVLTAANCPDLATVLSSKDMNYLTFCKKYDGRYVEFDAYVVGHNTYNGGVEHIIDGTGGDYDGQTEVDASDESTFDGLIIRIGDRTFGSEINKGVDVGDHVFVSGRIDKGWAEYFKCLYVETMELSRR